MAPKRQKAKAAAETAKKRRRLLKPIPKNLYALRPFGCNTVKTEIIGRAFNNTTSSSNHVPHFEAAFLTPSHLYTVFKTTSNNDDTDDHNNDPGKSNQYHHNHQLQLARMCLKTHVWSSCPDFPRLDLDDIRDSLQQSAYLPWSGQLVLFFLSKVVIVEILKSRHSADSTRSCVHNLSLETMLDVGSEDHQVTVNIPRLFAEWHAVAIDLDEKVLYVQCKLSMNADFVSRELGVYKLNISEERFERLVLLETENIKLKPALFMAVVNLGKNKNDEHNKISNKRLYIGTKEIETVTGRTGLKLAELMSLTSIIHINLHDLSDWGITSLSSETHKPLHRQIQIRATSNGDNVYLMTATGNKGPEHVLVENQLWELKLGFTDINNSGNLNLFSLKRLVGPQEMRVPEPPVGNFIFATSRDEIWVLCKGDQTNLKNGKLSSELQRPYADKKHICLYRIPLQVVSLKLLAQEAILHYRPLVGLLQHYNSNGLSKQERTFDHIQAVLKRYEVSPEYFDLPVKLESKVTQ